MQMNNQPEIPEEITDYYWQEMLHGSGFGIDDQYKAVLDCYQHTGISPLWVFNREPKLLAVDIEGIECQVIMGGEKVAVKYIGYADDAGPIIRLTNSNLSSINVILEGSLYTPDDKDLNEYITDEQLRSVGEYFRGQYNNKPAEIAGLYTSVVAFPKGFVRNGLPVVRPIITDKIRKNYKPAEETLLTTEILRVNWANGHAGRIRASVMRHPMISPISNLMLVSDEGEQFDLTSTDLG